MSFDVLQVFDGDGQILLELLIDVVDFSVIFDELVDLLGGIFMMEGNSIQLVLSFFDLLQQAFCFLLFDVVQSCLLLLVLVQLLPIKFLRRKFVAQGFVLLFKDVCLFVVSIDDELHFFQAGIQVVVIVLHSRQLLAGVAFLPSQVSEVVLGLVDFVRDRVRCLLHVAEILLLLFELIFHETELSLVPFVFHLLHFVVVLEFLGPRLGIVSLLVFLVTFFQKELGLKLLVLVSQNLVGQVELQVFDLDPQFRNVLLVEFYLIALVVVQAVLI